VRGSQMPLMYSVSLSKVAVIVASMAKLTSMKWPASDILFPCSPAHLARG
jgi:hypothetical protein